MALPRPENSSSVVPPLSPLLCRMHALFAINYSFIPNILLLALQITYSFNLKEYSAASILSHVHQLHSSVQ